MGTYLLTVGSSLHVPVVAITASVLAKADASIDDLSLRVVGDLAPLTVAFTTKDVTNLEQFKSELVAAFESDGVGRPLWLEALPITAPPSSLGGPPSIWMATFEVTEDKPGIVSSMMEWFQRESLDIVGFNARVDPDPSTAWIRVAFSVPTIDPHRTGWDLASRIGLDLESQLPGVCRLVEIQRVRLPALRGGGELPLP